MKVQLFNAEETRTHIISQLDSINCMGFRFAVAYATESGAKEIFDSLRPDSLRNLLARGGVVAGVVGINQGATSYEGLQKLLSILGDNLYLRYSKKPSHSFHPKVYIFRQKENSLALPAAIVGSSNLTYNGLCANEERGCFCEMDKDDEEFSNSIEKFWTDATEYPTRDNENFGNITCVSRSILSDLLKMGAIKNEIPQGRSVKKSNTVIKQMNDIANYENAPDHPYFLMTLGQPDINSSNSDNLRIHIPHQARIQDKIFWFWPRFFSCENIKFGEYSATEKENVCIDGKRQEKLIRLCNYVGTKYKFRLELELIDHYVEKNDILVVHREGGSMSLEIIRKADNRYNDYMEYLIHNVKGKSTKKYGYRKTL